MRSVTCLLEGHIWGLSLVLLVTPGIAQGFQRNSAHMQVRWAHLAKAETKANGREAAQGRRGAGGSSAQTGVILAATLGPLFAGMALSYFLSGGAK